MLMFRIYCLIFLGIIITCIVGLILNYKIEKIYIMCYNLYKFSKSKPSNQNSHKTNVRRKKDEEYWYCKNERGTYTA